MLRLQKKHVTGSIQLKILLLFTKYNAVLFIKNGCLCKNNKLSPPQITSINHMVMFYKHTFPGRIFALDAEFDTTLS